MAPQIKKKKKLMVDAGRASRLIKKRLTVEEVSNGRLASPAIANNEKGDEGQTHGDQEESREIEAVDQNIPREGPRAREIFRARRK